MPENDNFRSSSFITSLGDEELIAFINKLSQEKKVQCGKGEILPDTDVDTDPDTDIDNHDHQAETSHKVIVPSSPVLLASSVKETEKKKETTELILSTSNHGNSDEDRNKSVLGSITLAQNASQDSDTEGGLAFGDYETYFREKMVKQLQADEDYKKWDADRRQKQGTSQDELHYAPIFRGCIVYVNGRTDPDISQLHKMIVLHGGVFLHYLGAKGNATHIIASNLTPRKSIEFRNYKVVKPEWIVESISARKLLPWADYAVISNDYGQKTLAFSRPAPIDNRPLSEKVIAKPVEKAVDFVDERGGIVDAKHPAFLKHFFAKSRLHHLSTWKADLKYEFLQKALAKQTDASFQQMRRNNNRVESHRIIFHIDFDCFFAAVSALHAPGMKISETPIAVTHGTGSADIASCNYPARNSGVRNGMWVSRAKRMCPNLICLDYNFPEYERISRLFYDIVIELNCDAVFPVSVDEALLEVTSLVHHDDDDDDDDDDKVKDFARKLRQAVYEQTKCTVSIGAASNVLLAKLALRKAKPNGFYYFSDVSGDLDHFLHDVNIRDLPGVGYSISSKLEQKYGIKNFMVADLKKIDEGALINLFGIKTGTKLYQYSHGIDETDIDISKNPSDYVRKSISIDINWGIRFDTVPQVDEFLQNCAAEMSARLLKAKMRSSSVTLKLARRAAHAPIEPDKYLGMGECDFFTKSSRLGIATREAGLISAECKALYRILNVPAHELRGVSIQMTNLIDDELSAKQVSDQSRLPFAKIDADQFLGQVQRLREHEREREVQAEPAIPIAIEPHDGTPGHQNNGDASFHGIPDISCSSQYGIPSDVDSSLIRELPENIQRAAAKKKAKARIPVTEMPAVNQIDWDVFKALPPEIQRELKQELKRRDIPLLNKPDTPTLNRRVSPSAKFHLQPVFQKNPNDSKMVRVVSPSKSRSPRKKQRLSLTPQKKRVTNTDFLEYDDEVLAQLPSSVRRDLQEELVYEQKERLQREQELMANEQLEAAVTDDMEKPETVKTIQMTTHLFEEMSGLDGSGKPCFQRCQSFQEIKTSIVVWVQRTINVGPHEGDLVLFIDFIERTMALNVADGIKYLQLLNDSIKAEERIAHLGNVADDEYDRPAVSSRWKQAVELLRQVIESQCQQMNITSAII